MKNLGGIILGVATLLAGSALSGEIFYVDRGFQGEHPSGLSWHSAFPSVQEAIDAASGGGEIWVKSGIYKPAGNSREATFRLKPGIGLYGGFRGNETSRTQHNPRANRTILSGDIGGTGSRSDNCLHVATAAEGCRLDGFIVSAGHADGVNAQGRGAALLIGSDAKDFTVANCTFEKNDAARGGAIHASATDTTLSNCTFYSNSANAGGAILIGDGAGIHAVDCKFTSNFARESGGAIALRPTSKTSISRSWFLFNRTEGTGGAIAGSTQQRWGIMLAMDDCEFRGNSAVTNGGGLFFQGAFSTELTQCRFVENNSAQGAGAMASQGGATVSFENGTLVRNQSAKGFSAIESDAPAADGPVANLAVKPKPVVEIEPKHKLADLTIHTPPSSRFKLQSLVSKRAFTVFAFGDLTDPEFITTYRTIEASARDYSKKGVGFFYIHSYLAHPENNSYVQPVTLAERFQHILEAKRFLHTRIPWLCDGMDNRVAKTLERGTSNLFIYTQDGREEYTGTLADADGFGDALSRLAGPIESPTPAKEFAPPDLAPVNLLVARHVKRVKINPRKSSYQTLQATPLKSRTPLYVKVRAEASEALLKTGNGRLYLGFHLDPLYQAKWNNLTTPLEYAIELPRGTAMSPSNNRAKKVEGRPTDSEPREFLLEVRKWDSANPVAVTVTYSILSGRSNRIVEVSQRHIIHLKHDPFGGTVIGRQVPGAEKERKVTYGILLFKHFDADHDGMLSREEAPASLREKWDELDTDGDGLATEDEYRRYRKR